MATTEVFITQNPVTLEGYQAVMEPSKFGNFTLSTVFDQEMIDRLEQDRTKCLDNFQSKLKNPKRATLKPEPWEEVSKGKYMVKFRWNPDKDTGENNMPIVDTEGTPVTNPKTPIYGGAKVKVAFIQKPYQLPDGSYGTSLKLSGVQIVSLNASAGVDIGTEEVADLFGKTEGFKADDPHVIPSDDNEEADF